MRRFVTMIGLGLSLAIGGGLVYALITNETARLFIIAITMFILGATIVGVCIVAANYLLVRAFTARQERTTIPQRGPIGNYQSPATPPRVGVLPPWSSPAPPALPAPPSAWSAFGPHQMGYPAPHISERRDEGDPEEDYVA
jgi:hypothetical protein